MNINQAIAQLERLREQYGVIEVAFDCPYCQRVIRPVIIAVGPPVATLQGKVE